MNKLIAIGALCLFSSSAFASEEISKVESLKSIQIQDGQVKVSYLFSGGCGKHTPLLAVTLNKVDRKMMAQLKVMDSSAGNDNCEAVLEVTGSADLNDLILQAAKRQKIPVSSLKDVTVQLPSVQVTPK